MNFTRFVVGLVLILHIYLCSGKRNGDKHSRSTLTHPGSTRFCQNVDSTEKTCETLSEATPPAQPSSAHLEEDTPPGNMALVLYDESVISPFHIDKRTFTFGDISVDISQDWKAAGVAAVVWDAAVILGEYIEKNRHLLEMGPVLELGAGTGLAGIVAALSGGDVTITDRAVALDIIEKNVDLNRAEHRLDTVKIQELEWGKDLDKYKPYSLVLGADIIYIEETFQDLLDTFLHVCDSETVVLISCKIRYSRDSRFLSMMEEHFIVSEIHFEKQKDIHIYQCNKR